MSAIDTSDVDEGHVVRLARLVCRASLSGHTTEPCSACTDVIRRLIAVTGLHPRRSLTTFSLYGGPGTDGTEHHRVTSEHWRTDKVTSATVKTVARED